MGRIIIGLTGLAGSGKDTVASLLVREYGFTRLAFADAIKEKIGRNIFGLADEQLYGGKKEVVDPKYGVTPRDILLRTGDVIRQFHDNIWIDMVLQDIHKTEGDIVVTDVRYLGEADRLRKLGARIWRIERNGAGVKHGVSDHPSETKQNLIRPDLLIINNLGLTELFSQTKKAIEG